MEKEHKVPLFLSGFWLKIIALFTMTIDHIGFLMPYNTVAIVFRHIGRLALPLFCFMIAEGAIHTRNFKKYALRLGIMASVISLTMIVVEYGGFGFSLRDQGIIFVDLLLGATAIYCLRQKKWYLKLLSILPIIFGVLSFIASSLENCGCYGKVLWFPFFIRSQYGWFAILLIVLFYLAHYLTTLFIKYHSQLSGMKEENYRNTPIERNVLNIFSVIVLCAGSGLFYVCGEIMPTQYVFWLNNIQLFAMFSGVFILLYNGQRGYNKKWFQYGSYLYYPVHMLLLYLIFSLIN